jgi:hypothetical protein
MAGPRDTKKRVVAFRRNLRERVVPGEGLGLWLGAACKAGQREGLVVQGPGGHHVRENFVERADLSMRP